MRKWVTGCLGLLLMLAVCSAAIAEDIRFQHLSREQGLSQSFVLSMTQDKKGFMWFGTQNGLNRFDGYEVRVFNREQGGLPGELIRSLLSDSRDRLWVGTDNGGVALYQPESESFRVFDSETSQLPINRIRTFYELANGEILVGTDGAGVWRFDANIGDFVQHTGFGGGRRDSIWSLIEVGDTLLIGTGKGLYRQVRNGEPEPAFAGTEVGRILIDTHVRDLVREADGTLWVATDENGLLRIASDQSYQMFKPDVDIPGKQVFGLLQDDRGHIWFGTSNGLGRYRDGQIDVIRNTPGESTSLSNDMVIDLYEDRGGVIWVATYGGANYWSPNLYLAEHLFASTSTTRNPLSSAITSFAEGQDEVIWIGTIGGGVSRLDADGTATHYDQTSTVSIPDNDVMSLYVDSKGQVWVGTRTAGLLLLDASEGVVQRFHTAAMAPYQLSANAITAITETSFGQLLVTTYGGGFNQIDLDTFEVEQFGSGPGPEQLPTNRIMATFEDSTGGIWLGTDGAGVVYYDRHRQIFSRYGDGRGGFFGDVVLSIKEDGQGNLWFGTVDSGLFKLKRDSRGIDEFKFERLSKNTGLNSNAVYAIEIDNQDGVWLSSNAGISHMEVGDDHPHSLGLKNGLQDLEFNSGASLKLANGDLLFGGVNGFNRISPDDVEHKSPSPEVAITTISKQGVSVPVQSAERDGIELSHRDYFLEFNFSGMDYSDIGSVRYRYRLVGLQDEWVLANDRRYVSYNNLQPGEYVFEVQALNGEGTWSSEPQSISVLVDPAPWRSGWAFVLYAVVLLVIAFLIYRAVKSRHEHIEEVQAINARLREEVKVRRETDEQIRLEREKTQRYLDVAEVMLVAVDVEGTILNANEKTATLLGQPVESLIGQGILEYIRVAQRNEMRQKILSVFDEDDRNDHIECQVQDADNNLHTIIWRLAPLSKHGGHANQLLASGTDITELRQLERAVRFKEKLSALGTLSAGIAHDFNNILTAISGYNDLAMERVGPGSDVHDFLQRVDQASNRASDLVGRILSVTQVETGRFATVDLVEVVKDSVGFLQGGLPANVKLGWQYPDIEVLVDADKSQLQQMITNLGSNTANALAGEEGRLDIYVEVKDLTSEDVPKASTIEPGAFALIHVRDTGPGMPEAMRQRIFDPFYSSEDLGDSNRIGAGLGLSIVHGTVLNHKGHIDVESHLGMGTHFTIYLPISTASADGKVVPLPAKVNKNRVMLVDDEEWIVDVTSRLLASFGLEVEAFLHPLEALERFKSGAKDFALVITDQNMPQMKGTDLINALRAISESIPLVLMSGNVSPLAEDDSVQFLAKPFRMDDLRKTLARLGIEAKDDLKRSPG